MKIRFNNVFLFLFTLTALALFISRWPHILAALKAVENVNPDHPMNEQILGLFTLGLIGIFIVAITRILTRSK